LIFETENDVYSRRAQVDNRGNLLEPLVSSRVFLGDDSAHFEQFILSGYLGNPNPIFTYWDGMVGPDILVVAIEMSSENFRTYALAHEGLKKAVRLESFDLSGSSVSEGGHCLISTDTKSKDVNRTLVVVGVEGKAPYSAQDRKDFISCLMRAIQGHLGYKNAIHFDDGSFAEVYFRNEQQKQRLQEVLKGTTPSPDDPYFNIDGPVVRTRNVVFEPSFFRELEEYQALLELSDKRFSTITREHFLRLLLAFYDNRFKHNPENIKRAFSEE
jgi:hypothetical protein